jgi:hypothetical protein
MVAIFLLLTCQFRLECGHPSIYNHPVTIRTFGKEVTVAWEGNAITIPYTPPYSTDGTNHLFINEQGGKIESASFHNNETRWEYRK